MFQLRYICTTLINLIDKAAWQVKLKLKLKKIYVNRRRHYVYTFQFSRDRTAVEFKNRRQLREENRKRYVFETDDKSYYSERLH